jgi:predicted N-acetyltransferase YhbS
VETATGLTIREAKPDDAAALHQIFVSAIWDIDDSFYDQEQKRAWENAVEADSWSTRMLELAFIVAEINGCIVGFASWSDTKLEHLYVAAESGRKAVGTTLMKTVLSKFERKEIELVASNNAHSFYLRFGFVDQEHLVKQLGYVAVPCIRMKRSLV